MGSSIVATATGTEMLVAGATVVSAAASLTTKVKFIDVFSPQNAKVLGWVSVGVDMAKGAGYLVKALDAETGASQARYGQRAAGYFFQWRNGRWSYVCQPSRWRYGRCLLVEYHRLFKNGLR